MSKNQVIGTVAVVVFALLGMIFKMDVKAVVCGDAAPAAQVK